MRNLLTPPLVIQASLNLRNIISISEINQQIYIETTFRLYWNVSWEVSV
jgi:hypothetical protein